MNTSPHDHYAKTVRTAPSDVPVEFLLVGESLAEILREAAHLSLAKVASVRIMTSDTSQLRLFQTSRLDHPLRETIEITGSLTSTSVHGWVAATGQRCYIRDLLGPKPFRDYGGLQASLQTDPRIRSEFCAPLRVRGRLVGTFDLQSEHRDAFAHDIAFINALIYQIQSLLNSAQLAAEREILHLAAETTLHFHDLLKARDRVLELTGALNPANTDGSGLVPSNAAPLLEEISKRLASALGTEPHPDSTTTTRSSLAEIVRSITEDLFIHGWVTWETPSRIAEKIFPVPVAARHLRTALFEVLVNAFNASFHVLHHCIGVSIWSQRRAGVKMLCLTVSNSLTGNLPRHVKDRLYRLPIEAPLGNRPHIGAFIAGALLRQIGGDIWMQQPSAEENPIARTTIEIPGDMLYE